jgi:hypothetical protein
MVRKCLSYDFGAGTKELNDESLQKAFYSDVICELDRLERKFRDLQIGT